MHKIGCWLCVRMVCFSLERSHRALLRIIHAIVFDAHHAVWNGVDKVRRRILTLALFPVPKARRRASSRTKRADKSAKTFSPINLKVLRRFLSFTLEAVLSH